MFRNILLSTLFVTAAGTAFAADLPARMAAPAPVIAAPVYSWTGFYAGVNAGGAFNTNGDTSIGSTGLTAPNNLIYSGSNGHKAGFTGGAQAGYNMQFGSFVAGFEADINYIDRKRGGSGAFPAPADLNPNGPLETVYDDRTDFAITRGNGGNFYGTMRGRLGVALDRVLVFGTGGLAFGGRLGGSQVTQRDYYENSLNPDPVNLQGPVGTFTQTVRPLSSTGRTGSSIGWTLGGGVEYALTNSISLKLDYLHIDLGNSSQTATTLASPAPGARSPVAGQTSAAGNTITVRNENKFDVVRAGVNFRF